MKTDTSISFTFAGDVTLGGQFIPYAEKHHLDLLHPFKLINSHFSETDIFFMNLEGPVFTGPKKRQSQIEIHSNHPDLLKLFKNKNKFVFSLSNNHIMDYGLEGIKHTKMLLRKKGIYFLGAGENIDEASRELIIDHKGKRIAFLAYTSNERHIGAVIAGPHEAGCASYLDLDKVITKIHKLRNNVDIICISLHWGHEYFLYPSNEQVNIAHSLVDAGANYVIGHHPHVVQGIEEYKDSLIMYSLGEVFLPTLSTIYGRPSPTKRIAKEFIIIKSSVSMTENISFDLIGGKRKKNYLLYLYDDRNQQKFKSKIEGRSRSLICNNYHQFWIKYKAKREKELTWESLIDAFKKIFMIPLKDLINSLSLNDIKRNIARLVKVLST